MRYVRDNTGRFPQRPHYDPKELDRLFEQTITEFLRGRHGLVEFPISTDDLTVLIEQECEDLDSYADLSEYGAHVEGVTEFRRNRKPRVRISQHLGEAENRQNRYRTTLTHEFGHVKLHGYLFALDEPSTGLLQERARQNVIACKRDTIVGARQTDWMEWQAGYACSALLMPRTAAMRVAGEYVRAQGLFGAVSPADGHGQALISLFVERFGVSREAARVRLSVLGVLGTPKQPSRCSVSADGLDGAARLAHDTSIR